MEKIEEKVIELTENEKLLIESKRLEMAKLEEFKSGYQDLVEKTGFAWGVDLNSPLGQPKLGIVKIN